MPAALTYFRENFRDEVELRKGRDGVESVGRGLRVEEEGEEGREGKGRREGRRLKKKKEERRREERESIIISAWVALGSNKCQNSRVW